MPSGQRSEDRRQRSVEAELLANRASECVLDFGVPRHGSDPAVRRIDVNIVVRAVAFQITTAINESAHELASLHSEIESSCFSFGTNTLSEASSTIRWYASRIIA